MARDGGFRQLHLLLSAKRREPLTRDPGRCKIYGKSASVGRVWTAPLVQGVSEKNPDAVRFAVVCPACVLRPAAAGPDGFRDPLPNGKVTLVAATLRGFCGSSDRPISICSLEPCTRGPAARPRRQTCGQAAGCGR